MGDQAGATMRDIARQVRKVNELIGEITAFILQQASGAAQINQAVTSLDQGTRQGAARVAESAVARNTREQAHELADVIAMFRLKP